MRGNKCVSLKNNGKNGNIKYSDKASLPKVTTYFLNQPLKIKYYRTDLNLSKKIKINNYEYTN